MQIALEVTLQNTLLMIFTGILAVAVLVQSFLFFGMYKSIRKMAAWMDDAGKDMLRNMELISSKVEEGLTALRGLAEDLKPITEKLASTTDIVHRRVTDLDAFLAEATSTARLEILKIQDTIQMATNRVRETMDLLHNSVLAPITEIGAITRAIRVGLDVLFRRRKTLSGSSAQDEEMFI